MRTSREEAESLMRQHVTGRGPDRAAASPELLRQAVIATEHLTGQPEWDVFLQRIQAFINDEKALISSMTDNLPANMTSEQVLQAHRRICESRAKVEAWERVLSLPKSLLSASSSEPKAA